MHNDKRPPEGYIAMSAPYPQPGFEGNYPPPPAYSSGIQPQPAVIVAPVSSTVIVGGALHDSPAATVCPSCRQNIVTRVEYNSGLLTWLLFVLLLLFGCWLGCCLIPFCVDGCKDVDHFCPNCNNHIYKYKRL
ncbi:lITAF domain-containing protein [Rhinophrynus dorsalis]